MYNEKSLEKSVIKWAEKRGVIAMRLSDVGSRGFPDVFFAKNGKVCFIEFKSPTGKGKLHPLQKEMIDKLESNRVSVHVSADFKDSLDFLNKQFGDLL